MSTPYYNADNNPQHHPVIVQGQVVTTSATIPTVQGYEPPGKQQDPPAKQSQHYYYEQQQPPPLHLAADDNDITKHQVQPQRFRDVFWAILFYAHLIIMAWVAATYIPQMTNIMAADYAGGGGGGERQRRLMWRLRFLEQDDNNNNNNNNNAWNYYSDNDNNNDNISLDLTSTLTVVALSGVSGLLLSTFALGFMIGFAETLIKVGIVFSIVLTLLSGLAALLVGQVGGALMGLLTCGLLAWYACNGWSRIPFAAANLVTATTVIQANLGVAVYAYFSLLLTFGWAVWWTASAISTFFVVGECDGDGTCDKDVNGFLLFLFFVSYFWTVQVISNVVAVTVAGVTGTWWFAPLEAASCCSQAVVHSYWRAMTYSFGSICFGSLIVALISATRQMIHSIWESSDDSIVACLAECLLSCIESLVEYFNEWAYTFVGIYGYSFMEAGMEVMNLFKQRGWTVIITDDLTERALLIVSFCVALLNGLMGMLLGSSIGMGEGVPLIIPFFVGFITGIALCSTLFSVVGSACKSVIVLYAEAPNEFQANHPELSSRMRASWQQAWPVDFKY